VTAPSWPGNSVLWIRVDCDICVDELWEDFGNAVGCGGMAALGHYIAFTGRYAERMFKGRFEGRLDQLQDSTIEKWANWPGPPGLFAAALRSLCTDADSGELQGFREQNGKLLEKQLTDSGRHGLVRRTKRGEPAANGNPSGNPSGNVNAYEYGNVTTDTNALQQLASEPDESLTHTGNATSPDPKAYLQRCTQACNRGLAANSALVNGFTPLEPSRQTLPPHLAPGGRAGQTRRGCDLCARQAVRPEREQRATTPLRLLQRSSKRGLVSRQALGDSGEHPLRCIVSAAGLQAAENPKSESL
jgi:hypothetical protein